MRVTVKVYVEKPWQATETVVLAAEIKPENLPRYKALLRRVPQN